MGAETFLELNPRGSTATPLAEIKLGIAMATYVQKFTEAG
jgi:hypothetical protein